jgi:(p)ppGpp synthase/HD superfamily hydrolase
MDHQSIMAAILHDVIEDTGTAKEQIAKRFGETIAEMVDGVSKLTNIQFESKAEAQAENFRKMMLAMTRDIRVILIKLADRLHNMRTLGVMRPDKRRRIARETLEIYAPIANRLGMNRMRLELEDLGFAAMYPLRSKILVSSLKKARGNRKEVVNKIEDAIRQRLVQDELEGEVVGREKHIYSIYKKMKDKHLPFSEVMDVYAMRIIVDSVDSCYRVLGAVHNLYTPMPGRFKDYIAIPKANGYQSLHTVLFSPYGVASEIQIRTEDMHRVAETGIAAHWTYKSTHDSKNNAELRARQWLHDVLEIQQKAGNSIEFLENVKVNLFPDEVYVFTPKGDILVLPRGATAVDFAYRVEATMLGTRLLNKSLAAHGSSMGQIGKEQVKRVLKEYNFNAMEDMYSEIGLGNQMAMVIARAILSGEEDGLNQKAGAALPLVIRGTEGAVVTFAKCCRPIPGDSIIGFVTSGRGIVVHTEDCKNVAEYKNRPEKWVEVAWEENITNEFAVDLRLLVLNKRGALATVASALSDLEANIENVTIDERDGLHNTMSFTVSIRDRIHLARVLRHLRSLDLVVRINRQRK